MASLRDRLAEAIRGEVKLTMTDHEWVASVGDMPNAALGVFAGWAQEPARISLVAKVLYAHREPSDMDGQFRRAIRCACGWSAKREHLGLDESRVIWWAHQAQAALKALCDEMGVGRDV